MATVISTTSHPHYRPQLWRYRSPPNNARLVPHPSPRTPPSHHSTYDQSAHVWTWDYSTPTLRLSALHRSCPAPPPACTTTTTTTTTYTPLTINTTTTTTTMICQSWARIRHITMSMKNKYLRWTLHFVSRLPAHFPICQFPCMPSPVAGRGWFTLH